MKNDTKDAPKQGPYDWTIEDRQEGGYVVIDRNQNFVAKTYSMPTAEMIVAAPRLLAANAELREALEQADKPCSGTGGYCETHDNCGDLSVLAAHARSLEAALLASRIQATKTRRVCEVLVKFWEEGWNTTKIGRLADDARAALAGRFDAEAKALLDVARTGEEWRQLQIKLARFSHAGGLTSIEGDEVAEKSSHALIAHEDALSALATARAALAKSDELKGGA